MEKVIQVVLSPHKVYLLSSPDSIFQRWNQQKQISMAKVSKSKCDITWTMWRLKLQSPVTWWVVQLGVQISAQKHENINHQYNRPFWRRNLTQAAKNGSGLHVPTSSFQSATIWLTFLAVYLFTRANLHPERQCYPAPVAVKLVIPDVCNVCIVLHFRV